ncbi:hypothetical protein HID58_057397 [Brassica napus]|uniref:UBC core domain-containing protein n=1 Tax=Brassica napus TaxID=3708 RepID=A0ABQ8ARV6_BRANA|nr:hypothetical protein HID58_057397 [Brassica napus]
MNFKMGLDLGWASATSKEDNIFCWKGAIKGSIETVFKRKHRDSSKDQVPDYFDVYGNICLDILQNKWSSAYDVRTILLSIQSLLGELNISSPLNTQAARLWSNQEEYRKMPPTTA